MDIYLLNEIQKLEAGGGGSAGASGTMFLPRNKDGSLDRAVIPIVSRSGQRQSAKPHSWSTSYAGTTFYTHSNNAHSQRIRFWMASGISRKDGNEFAANEGTGPEIFYANNGNVGVCKSHTSWWTGNNYAPWRTSIMFLRNKGTATKSATAYVNVSSQYTSGYDGASLTLYKPNSADYASVSSITATTEWSYTTTSQDAASTQSFTIPAGHTVAVVLANSMRYHQDTNSNASWQDNNGFYNLNTTFSDPDIVPDLEMTQTYLMMRHHTTSYTNDASSVWNARAIYFPE